MADNRGFHGELDFEAIDCALGLADGRAQLIYALMTERRMVDPESNSITAWDQRQPKREREDNTNADRQRTYKAKQNQVTPSNATVTPSNASDNQKTPRGEERREEEIREEEKTHAISSGEDAGAPDLRVSRQAAVCMVIKSEGIGSVNPQHPDLLALIEQGADVGHFAAAAKTAKDKGKGFAYVLGIVRGQIAEAKGIAGMARVAATAPNKQEALEASNRAVLEKYLAKDLHAA